MIALEQLLARVERVTESGCWIWMGKIQRRIDGSAGYGRAIDPHTRREAYVHRVSYVHYKGAIPGGLKVCHHCDVRCCINPDHLFIGTQRQNLEDASVKGRMAKKLTLAKAREIKVRLNAGERVTVIARAYGVRMFSVQQIRDGQAWKSA